MSGKILVADDSATSRAMLGNALSKWGYEPLMAQDGLEALEILTGSNPPAIAILDWVMPGITGPDLCKLVREHQDQYIYLILLTSKNTKGETVEGLESGADDYIVKPFDQQELQVRLRVGLRILASMSRATVQLPAIEFYSCFISHSSIDCQLAALLDSDLRHVGVKSWYAPEDLRIGDEFRLQIDKSIRLHDKLLLILSEASINSEWVTSEVEAALDQESVRKRGDPELQGNTTVIFPISIDDAIFRAIQGWAALIRRTRHVGDFRDWRDPTKYKKAFARLLRDLQASDELDRRAEDMRRRSFENR